MSFCPLATHFLPVLDINECLSAELNNCPYGCNNTIGSYLCTCPIGFKIQNVTTCVDVDECTDKSHDCHKNAACKNTVGSFSCDCRKGYTGDGRNCTGTTFVLINSSFNA